MGERVQQVVLVQEILALGDNPSEAADTPWVLDVPRQALIVTEWEQDVEVLAAVIVWELMDQVGNSVPARALSRGHAM